MMIDRRTVFDIHRLAHEGLSVRKIAATLGLSRQTVHKYLGDPNPQRPRRPRASKLEPFTDDIAGMLDSAPQVSALVMRQRLAERGFDGGMTIVRDYLSGVRPSAKPKAAFIRFESEPGVQGQIDWGHFGSLAYGHTTRNLYGLAVVECYSRLL
jgi:transposase